MHDYLSLTMMINPIEEKDLILFDCGVEEKGRIVKQYNRALTNAKGEGTDVAQIFLKPLISTYQTWGDPALIFGLCLAREGQFSRAEQSLQFAIANVLGSEKYLGIAQDALRMVREDMKNPEEAHTGDIEEKLSSQKMAEGGMSPAERRNYQAPILVRASKAPAKNQMATPKERRDIMMRSGAVGDDMPDDSIEIEDLKSPADRMHTTIRIIVVLLCIAALALIVIFGIIPLASKVKRADETDKKIEYLMEQFEANKDDPEVAAILESYASEFDISGGN